MASEMETILETGMCGYSSNQALFLIFVIYGHAKRSSPQHFETQTNTKIKEDFTFLKEPSIGIVQCAAHCARNKTCMSASYNSNEGTCNLSTYEVNEPGEEDKLSMDSWSISISRRCSGSWYEIWDTCYYFNQEWVNFTDAGKYCEEVGGKLAEPVTNAIFELLRMFLLRNQNLDSIYWIGLDNLDGNGTFVWTSNGAVPTYTYWSDYNEPYDWPGYNCTIIASYDEYKWISSLCDSTAGQLCEK